MEKWNYIEQDLLDLLNKEWEKTSNVNAFLFARFVDTYPVFAEPWVLRGQSNRKGYVLKKSLIDRLVNKIMTCSKSHTGKKVLAKRILEQVLEPAAKAYGVSKTNLLILLLVKSVPNFTIRRLKFGSGFLTRAVRITILKKISWFLKTWTVIFKNRSGSFKNRVKTEIDLIMSDSPKSILLNAKRELDAAVEKANIQ